MSIHKTGPLYGLFSLIFLIKNGKIKVIVFWCSAGPVCYQSETRILSREDPEDLPGIYFSGKAAAAALLWRAAFVQLLRQLLRQLLVQPLVHLPGALVMDGLLG